MQTFENARVIGSSCAAWHLHGFTMFKRIPAVQGLDVHLEHGQYQQWEEGTEREVEPRETTLTQWLYYIAHPPSADAGCRQERYMNFVTTHTWTKPTDTTPGGWAKRKPGARRAVGNMYAVPCTSDVFYLRLLLTKLTGADLDMSSAEDPLLRQKSFTFDALRSAPDAQGARAK